MNKKLKKALEEYFKKSHNEVMRNYGYSGEDIKRLMLEIDLSKFDNSSFTLDGNILKGSPLWFAVQNSQKQFQIGLRNIVRRSMFESWKKGNILADEMLKKAYDNFPKDELKHNPKSWKALENRQLFKGRTLSGRIWTLSNDYKREITETLRVGHFNGESADKVAKRLVKYINKPEQREVDLKKLGKESDVKGSVFKKAKSLAGNERNIAFREAENDRMQAEYVLGFKINLSNAHPRVDICDFVNGDYPVWFKWNGWHPNCLCFRTYILPSQEELNEYFKARREKKEYIFKNRIKDVPPNFKSYMRKHFSQMNAWKSKPYFMVDNDISKLIGG